MLRDDRVKFVSMVILYSNYQKMGALNAFVNEALHEDTQCFTCSYINLNCVIDDLNEYRRLRNDILAKYYIYTNEQKDLVAQNLYLC